MTDTTTRPTAGTAARQPTHVWVCTFEHRDGTDIWACANEALAYRELAEVCREFWEEAREVDGVLSGAGAGLPVEPPLDDRSAVESYFAVMNDSDPGEWFLIAPLEVVGTGGGEDR
jgi:hypothetical protein